MTGNSVSWVIVYPHSTPGVFMSVCVTAFGPEQHFVLKAPPLPPNPPPSAPPTCNPAVALCSS